MYPDDELLFLLDHSSCHDKTRDDGLSTTNTTLEFGGAQPFLRNTVDVKSWGSEYPLHDLYAVSNHMRGLNSGQARYFLSIDLTSSGTSTTIALADKVDPNTVKRNHSSAYLLFYNRSEEQRSSSGDGSGSLDSRRQPLIRRQTTGSLATHAGPDSSLIP
jgi:hypothetical protein